MNADFASIYKALDIDGNNGLASVDNLSEQTNYQKLFFSQVREKLGVNSVYFLRDVNGVAQVPLIFFSTIDSDDSEKIAELHCAAWNMGEAPLLFIVTPTELKIYNNYAIPKQKDNTLDANAGLIETISLISDLETQRKQLMPYNRTLLESGEYWRNSKARFDTNTRIDTTLMNNLRFMRRKLIEKISKRFNEKQQKSINIISIVHGLLSRSILIKYLEERKDSNGESVFPTDFFIQFSYDNKVCKQYVDVLENKSRTYELFNVLEHKFNGDMLPLVENEIDIITSDDLAELKDFLCGNLHMPDQQLALWRLYDFNIIPIQIISSIYELFFHLSIDKSCNDKGTYYTPLHLVEMLLDEVFPWEGEYCPLKVIDPSCGSGIFLVEIYRRMVCRWMNSHKATKINNAKLTEIMSQCIYGVDINPEAVRVASFSLSLAMCDFLDPRSIWNELSFPKMVDKNLVVSDFFDETSLEKIKYDVVIGNPPWQSLLTKSANKYLADNNEVVGDKQIAQAFTIKCSTICKSSGVICLLMPSKGFLFNRSLRSTKYRSNFFKRNTVLTVINYSIYRHSLFANASGPATAIIYTNQKPKQNNSVLYCTPKPQYTIEDTKRFAIEPHDICRIPSDLIYDDRIWKIAMWGSPRDLELIDKMQRVFPALSELITENSMVSAEGFKRGNRSKKCNDFFNLPYVEAKTITPFKVEKLQLPLIDFTDFECVVAKKRDIFIAPHLIIKQSHKKSRFIAAVLDYDAVFNHSLLGIHGNKEMLKYLCLIINSKVFTYYHMLTNRKWLVERDELEAGDIWTTPIPIPNEEILTEASKIFDEINDDSQSNKRIFNFVSKVYCLQDYESELILDSTSYVYDYYNHKSNSMVFSKPTNDAYNLYYKILVSILSNTLEKPFLPQSNLYLGSAPLVVLQLIFEGNGNNSFNIIENDQRLNDLLAKLDSGLIEKRQNIYIRRNIRVYGNDAIYIIKPKQKKYWNYSSACRDADEIFADIIAARGK